jgi:hypothetical protein
MFEPTRVTDRFVAHPRHSPSYGCGSLRALGARDRFGMSANLWVEALVQQAAIDGLAA